MLTYKYYKFPSKESVPPDRQWPMDVSISHVGLISNNDAVYDEKGFVIKPPTYKSGWHVNVCYQGHVNLDFVQEYEINVVSPNEIWLGQQIN